MAYEILRWEEKAFIKAAEKLGVKLQLLYMKGEPVKINGEKQVDVDIVLQRSISHYVAMESTIALEAQGLRVVNSSNALSKCFDKLWTLSVAKKVGIPTPRTAVAFSTDAANKAAEWLGYPVVVKPVNGSWGRLICMARDKEELRAIMEHRSYLPGMMSKVHLMQEYVRKPGRDIRVFVVGDEVPVAIYRVSQHWITNTARGGKAVPANVDEGLEEMSLKIARALGGEVLGIDFFEDPERGYLLNEVNPIPEFKNTVVVTGYDLSLKIIEYVAEQAKR